MSTEDDVTADLPLLLTGELGRVRLREVVDHLRGCADCRAELVEAAAAHAALVATRRTITAPTAVTNPAAAAPTGPATDGPLADSSALPPLRAVEERRTARRRVVLGAVAAAVVLALGLGGAAVTGHWPGGRSTPPTAGRAADLEGVASSSGQVPVPGAAGVVQMTGASGRTDMTIRTSGLPQAASGHFYYAWLLDPTTNKMLPLGVVSVDGASTFEVADALVSRYSAIDISLQADDGNPAHSPVSVLRATYAT